MESELRNQGEGDTKKMDRAEQAGKARAKGFDPAVNGDYSKPKK